MSKYVVYQDKNNRPFFSVYDSLSGECIQDFMWHETAVSMKSTLEYLDKKERK